MSYKNDDFLIEKVLMLLSNNNADMFSLIGSVKDLFSSAYITKKVASDNVVSDLWASLFTVFSESKEYENQFDAIDAMYDIFVYAEKNDVNLNLEPLREWRNIHDENNISLEILECVDEMLIK